MPDRNRSIAVLDYGMGNIHSIIKALRLYHDDVRFTADPDELRAASAIVLPGDGAFAAAMDHLDGRFRTIIREVVSEGRPLLGVCIGFQVLFESSDEFARHAPGKNIAGLGLIPGHIRRFPKDNALRVPHMGWNQLSETKGSVTAWQDEYMYFIHSYRAVDVPPEFVAARCSYGGESFPAVVERDNIVGFQFHPEKSHTAGLRILEEWTERVTRPGCSA